MNEAGQFVPEPTAERRDAVPESSNEILTLLNQQRPQVGQRLQHAPRDAVDEGHEFADLVRDCGIKRDECLSCPARKRSQPIPEIDEESADRLSKIDKEVADGGEDSAPVDGRQPDTELPNGFGEEAQYPGQPLH